MNESTKTTLKQYINDIKDFCAEVGEAIENDEPEDALNALELIVENAELLINDIDV